MASEIGVPISVTAKMPDHFLDKVILDSEDSNAIMAAITDVAKDIRLLARRKMGSRQTGAYPARRSGRMMRNVRVKKSKPQRRGSFWARVQIDSFKDAFWYPAPLFMVPAYAIFRLSVHQSLMQVTNLENVLQEKFRMQ